MIPAPEYITISNNIEKIERLLRELVLLPRLKALEWSNVTKQTPNMKIGYPGQHLASLITGIEGQRTGARGDDLRDGTEVKSCSRVDQLDTCEDCKHKVLRSERTCSHCNSTKIKRKNDSKWLFGVKTPSELKLLTEVIPRIFLTIADYPNFESGDYETIRFQAFEIWNNTERHKFFKIIMSNYYDRIFLSHISNNPNKTPAPKNFWPYAYQFYLCNPVKVFNCIVSEANTEPSIEIDYYVEPHVDRSLLVPELMPTALLSKDELRVLLDSDSEENLTSQLVRNRTYQELLEKCHEMNEVVNILPFINENSRSILELRDTDKPIVVTKNYSRRK